MLLYWTYGTVNCDVYDDESDADSYGNSNHANRTAKKKSIISMAVYVR